MLVVDDVKGSVVVSLFVKAEATIYLKVHDGLKYQQKQKKTNRKSERTNEQKNIQTKKTNGPKQIRKKQKTRKK